MRKNKPKTLIWNLKSLWTFSTNNISSNGWQDMKNPLKKCLKKTKILKEPEKLIRISSENQLRFKARSLMSIRKMTCFLEMICGTKWWVKFYKRKNSHESFSWSIFRRIKTMRIAFQTVCLLAMLSVYPANNSLCQLISFADQ